jgi:hypothetical protein
MQTIFRKRLTASEKERHWIIVPVEFRRNFPSCNIEFNVRIRKASASTYIDSYNRLRLGSRIFNELELDSPNTVIIVEKEPSKKEYVLRVEPFIR